MAHFVLIHGMFHGGWCWDRLKPRLESAGHRVSAPDLAGCGSDATLPGEVTLERWARDTRSILEASREPVILVGHSRGGIVVSQAAELHPNNVAVLVYLTAVMVPSGSAGTSIPQITVEEGFAYRPPPFVLELTEDQYAIQPPGDAGAIFYSECSPADRAWALRHLSREPSRPLSTPLSLTADRWGAIPRVYIVTATDRVLDVGAQRAMIARTGADEVVVMDTDHTPLLSHVAELAGILLELADRYAGDRAVQSG